MSELTQQVEMHPQRWGDPAAAAGLPDSARGLIELAFGLADTPPVEWRAGAPTRAARIPSDLP